MRLDLFLDFLSAFFFSLLLTDGSRFDDALLRFYWISN
jgi:hypothetical protein